MILYQSPSTLNIDVHQFRAPTLETAGAAEAPRFRVNSVSVSVQVTPASNTEGKLYPLVTLHPSFSPDAVGLRFAEPGSLGENLRLALCPLNLLILSTVHTQYLETPLSPGKNLTVVEPGS